MAGSLYVTQERAWCHFGVWVKQSVGKPSPLAPVNHPPPPPALAFLNVQGLRDRGRIWAALNTMTQKSFLSSGARGWGRGGPAPSAVAASKGCVAAQDQISVASHSFPGYVRASRNQTSTRDFRFPRGTNELGTSSVRRAEL